MRALLVVVALTCSQVAIAQQQIAVTRELRIDGAAAQLVRPSRILVGADGRIVLTQMQDNNILFYDATGRLLGKFGRAGQGPGEFQQLFGAGWVGDSLWVYDFRARNTTIITPNRTLGRTSRSQPEAIYSDGSTLVRAKALPASPPAGSDSSGFSLERLARDGVTRSFVARIANFPTGVVGVTSGQFFSYVAVPNSTRSIFKVSDRGARFAATTAVFEGPQANTIRIVMFGANGDTVYARNYPFVPDRIPQNVVDAEEAKLLKQMAASPEPIPASARSQARVPRVYPPFVDMLVADDGTAWIALRHAPDGQRPFLILDPRGNPLGTATLPKNTTPMSVSATHFWGVELDSDDVPSVVRYRWSRIP